MIALTSSEVRTQWADVIDRVRVGGDRVVVEKNGKRMVAVISIKDHDMLERFEEAVDVREARAAIARSDFVPWESVRAQIGKPKKKAKRAGQSARAGKAQR